MARKKEVKAGKLSIEQMRQLVNKKAGMQVAHDLNDENNPTNVTDWIPTGSRWLDGIICRGKLSGIPVGKVTEIAGLESSGKSYMAAQIAANAQKHSRLHYHQASMKLTQTALTAVPKSWSEPADQSEIVIFRVTRRAIPYSAPLRGASYNGPRTTTGKKPSWFSKGHSNLGCNIRLPTAIALCQCERGAEIRV